MIDTNGVVFGIQSTILGDFALAISYRDRYRSEQTSEKQILKAVAQTE